MSDIHFTGDGFVDMDQFDGSDPDAFASLVELGPADPVPDLADDGWNEMLGRVFDGEIETDLDVDALVGSDEPFDEVDGDDGSPFDVGDLWGGGDEVDTDDGGRDDALVDDDTEDESDIDDIALDDLPADDDLGADDTGASVGEMLEFDDGDVGSSVGEMLEFDEGDDVGIDDDLDALENLDFDS